MIEVHSDAQAAVALVFERVHLSQPYCHAQPSVDAHTNLRLVGALGSRLLERVGDQPFEILVCERRDGLLFGCHG